MEKMYLTPELIKHVERSANDIVWKMGVLSKFTKYWYDVLTVSPLGLIHIEGNDDTGWKHISERHGYFSNSSYFGGDALGNPSKFTKNCMPIYDFRNVADDIYQQQQKDTRPHPDGERFEKYNGASARHTGANGIPKEFHLVLYKGTKIVHSLYPKKTLIEKTPKRVLKEFAKDKAKIGATTRPGDDYFLVNIPYINEEQVTRYVIIFQIDKKTQMTKGYIQVNALNGCPIYTTWPHLCHFPVNTVLPPLFGDIPIEFVRFINGLTLADLSKLEMIIAKIEKGIQEVITKQESQS